jgi:hypothetical protein
VDLVAPVTQQDLVVTDREDAEAACLAVVLDDADEAGL